MAFLKTLFDGNEREISRLRKTAERVNALETQTQALSDDQLREKTVEFRSRIADGEQLAIRNAAAELRRFFTELIVAQCLCLRFEGVYALGGLAQS